MRPAAGTFTFCDFKMGRNAVLTTLGPATLNVQRNVVIGTASTFGPAVGDTPIVVNVAGKLVRVSQSAVANAAFFAPAGRIIFGRDSRLLGCFWARTGRRATSTSRSSAASLRLAHLPARVARRSRCRTTQRLWRSISWKRVKAIFLDA